MLVPSARSPLLLRADDAQLLVVDMQEPFLRSVCRPEELQRSVALLMDAARILRVPIVPTLQNRERLGGPVDPVGERLPADCIPFDKLVFSCAQDQAIVSEMRRSGRRQVIICGVEAHICVTQTTLDLIEQGYQVHVAIDAISSRTEGNWECGVRRMEHAGAVISSAEMAVYELLYVAGTPEFREILKLVR